MPIEPYYIAVEFMANGNLKDFLQKSHKMYDYAYTMKRQSVSSLTQLQLMTFAKQIADGMDFIASNQVETQHVYFVAFIQSNIPFR